MSSGTSYDWASALEAERQRVVQLRAELARLHVRAAALRKLRAAAASRGIHAEMPRIAEVGTVASSDELNRVVTAARVGLDALDRRLSTELTRHQEQRERAWDTAVATSILPQADSATAAVETSAAVEDTRAVQRAAQAAVELVEAEADRCEESDVAHLRTLAGRIAELEPTAARTALWDVRVRVTESIGRRRQAEEAQQLRAGLLSLTEGADPDARNELRRKVLDAPDDELSALREPVEDAVSRESRRLAREDVTRRLVEALQEQGYTVGADFADVLTTDQPILLQSSVAPDYGLRLWIDPERDRLQTTVVRREDSVSGADLEVQQMACDDLEVVEHALAAQGRTLTVSFRRGPNGQVPTMAAQHWREWLPSREQAEQSRRRIEEHRRRLRNQREARGGR